MSSDKRQSGTSSKNGSDQDAYDTQQGEVVDAPVPSGSKGKSRMGKMAKEFKREVSETVSDQVRYTISSFIRSLVHKLIHSALRGIGRRF